jgi:arginyl-tRNA synthetase
MSNLIKSASAELSEMIMQSLGILVAEGTVPSEPVPAFKIEIPADKSHGDFAANTAMVCAKAFRMPPRKIAELICSKFDFENNEHFERAEIAGPGFINFFLSRKWFSEVIENVNQEKDNYGRTDTGKGKKILVEFVSANPTGPMHVGNARGGAIGDCLASVLEWSGYTVEREFYINDAGNQIEKFGKSLSLRYMQIFSDEGMKIYSENGISTEELCRRIYGEDGNKPEFPMPEDTYRGMDIIEHAKNFADENGDSLVNISDEERRKKLVEYALPKNIAGLERDLKKYRIEYNTWFRESSLHNNGAVADIIKQLTDKGCTYESDGAVWFRASDFGADKDFVLVRANGIPTYVVPDIAYHYNKLVTRGFDKAIDVLGADHHGYVPRLKSALTALGVDASKLDVVLMQMVRLMRNGEIAKLSKRSGKAITLVTLLDEIPIDAARFFFNLREANSHFEFDLDLAVEKSSQNPVYYVQYAHARICSIINNLAEEGFVAEKASADMLDMLSAPQEIELIRYIASLPDETDNAAKNYDPAKITKYAVELATKFHKFYDSCSVKNAETDELKYARLALCSAVRHTLRNVLTMLKIECPEKM